MQHYRTHESPVTPVETSAAFRFKTPHYSLYTKGIHEKISVPEWTGRDVAHAFETAFANAPRSNGQSPVIVGAIPFSAQQPAHLYIPKHVQWGEGISEHPTHEQDRSTNQIRHIDGEDSPAYRAAVAKALRRISTGAVEKVVLARRVRVSADRSFDTEAIFNRLCALNQSAFVYQLNLPERPNQEPPVLLGASPELVLKSANGAVQSAPLAGSIPRVSSTEFDERRSQNLLRSQKDLHEHAVVVRAVGEQFRRHCTEISVPGQPKLVKTPVIWHLGSKISGLLRAGIHPIQLAYALHPTPAVSGWPQKASQRAIAELEDFERGFYAGLIGWIDAEGNGEWALTLRCGLIQGNRAQVFAGAGIVENSNPEAEHTETKTKLRTFLNALGPVEVPVPA